MTTLPAWLADTHVERPHQSHQTPLSTGSNSNAPKALMLRTFDIILPTILDKMAQGSTLAHVFREDHRDLDVGAFTRWLYADPQRTSLYKEAKEIRSEAWASKIVEIAEATENPLEDVTRSKLKIDTYRFLMGADNRRTYGDTKTIDVGGTISVIAALSAANARAATVIDVSAQDVSDATTVEDQTEHTLQIAQDRAYDALMSTHSDDE
jgi:hypothetical protein